MEGEKHYLLVCESLKDIKGPHLEKLEVRQNVPTFDNIGKIKYLLSKQNMKTFYMLHDMLGCRKSLIYENQDEA